MKSKGGSRSVKANLAKSFGGVPDIPVAKSGAEIWGAYEVKDKNKTDKLIGKYKPLRNRDFTSQIISLPGPKSILTRDSHEISDKSYKIHGVRLRDNQAFISDIDDKFNAHKIDMTKFPSHKKAEVPLDPSTHRKGYDLKRFVLREKYDFLNPGKAQNKAF